MRIETECEEDGRWIAEVVDLPGVLVYGKTLEHAVGHAKSLARQVLQSASGIDPRRTSEFWSIEFSSSG